MSNWVPSGWRKGKVLGEGGQGTTYLVTRSTGSDPNTYVLKRLKNKKNVERFRREVEVLQKLSHPGIIQIPDSGIHQETPFLVSEYCENGDLTRAELRGKPLLEGLYRQICDAVSAAHSSKIVHRDIKPSNIFIRKDGSLAVGDFGLCFDLGGTEDRITHTLEAVGARYYTAPELEEGRAEEITPSSDCYSLGKLLYFLLTGRIFSRERHREKEFDLRTADSDPPVHFVYEVLDKCIHFAPSTRFQNAGELRQAVDGVITKMKQNAHVLKINVPQPCMYCVSGLLPAYGRCRLGCRAPTHVQPMRKHTGLRWPENVVEKFQRSRVDGVVAAKFGPLVA